MTQGPRRHFASRFAIRFAIILALAMLPAGFFAFIQTKALEQEIQVRSEVALMGATLQAASAETSMIGRVRGMVGSLAGALPYVIADPKACSDLMLRLAAVEPTASLIAYVPVDGKMTCSSSGRVHDFSGNPLFQEVRDAKAPHFIVNPNGPISGTSVLGISHPVYDANGTYIGYASMSLPHEALRELRFASLDRRSDPNAPVDFWTFNKDGTLLTSNLDLVQAARQLPQDRPLAAFVGSEGEVFQGTSVSGRAMTYATVPIVPGDLYLMSSFRPEEPAIARDWGMSVYLPTLLMWLVGLAVSGFAAEFLVTRHVRILNRSIVSFARGDRRLQAIDLRNAPSELDELASAYQSMTESITRSEAELEDSLHQKEVLLREVHHRVKNNLQLISSIMNIQIRSARSGEAKDLLKNLQERIMSLATVHRGLYQTSGLADVRARELIPDIVRQILSMSSGPEKPFATQNDIDDLRLVPDQAVPLSLLLAEALTNAIKHSGATRANPGRLTVRLKRSGGSDAVLEVINRVAIDHCLRAATGRQARVGPG
jgi:two-component system, sensor histidine kinase PdtaS